MIFLLSLALAAGLILALGQSLRQKPVPFYMGAAVLSLAVFFCTVQGVAFPAWFQNWVWPLFARSAFATALWAAVMWAGALPNGSWGVKKIMPIRGQLSILAGILTLGHNGAYGITYFRFLFTNPGILPANQLLAALCSLVMIAIMLPLFVTSFPQVRRKMQPKKWKRLQRAAYLFYGLLYVHIMLLTAPLARQGRQGYGLTVFAYSTVFLSYGLCRVMKAQAMKQKQPQQLAGRQKKAAAGVLVLSLCMTVAVAAPGLLAAPVEDIPEEEGIQNEQDTPEQQEQAIEPVNTQQSEETDPEPEEKKPEDQPEPDQPEEGQQPEQQQNQQPETPAVQPEGEQNQPEEKQQPQQKPEPQPEQPAQQPKEPEPQPEPEPEPAPEPEPEPEPVRVYRNGTFTGSGQGFEGTITVNVTIQDDVITGVSVVSASDDEPFFSQGKGVIDKILSAQSADVSTVSGATYSSGGILQAVKSALASAKN